MYNELLAIAGYWSKHAKRTNNQTMYNAKESTSNNVMGPTPIGVKRDYGIINVEY
jgi:hypothetical protein